MNINLTPILQAVIILAAAIITYVVVPWIKAHTTETQQRKLNALYEALCYAAEQIYGAGNGEEKFQYVCEQLRERGLEVDPARIEATVYENFNFKIPRLGLPVAGEPEEENEENGTTPQAAAQPATLTRGAEEDGEPGDDLIRPCGPPSPEGEGKGETDEEPTEETAEEPESSTEE